MSRRLPTIHGTREQDAGPYRMEQLDLEFANGERRQYHRLRGKGHGAVYVVPMLDEDTVLLVREYAVGMHRYELGLVSGRIDAGETAIEAANRELQEEAGYGARSLHMLRMVSLSPRYMTGCAKASSPSRDRRPIASSRCTKANSPSNARKTIPR